MNPFVLESVLRDTPSNQKGQFSTAADRKPQKVDYASPQQFRRLDGIVIFVV